MKIPRAKSCEAIKGGILSHASRTSFSLAFWELAPVELSEISTPFSVDGGD